VSADIACLLFFLKTKKIKTKKIKTKKIKTKKNKK